MPVYAIVWIWFASAVATTIIGHARQALLAGLLLGLFLGPLGIPAAMALDGRPACPYCAGRLDGRGKICQHCHRPIRWEDVEGGLLTSSIKLFGSRGSNDCPHCSVALEGRPAECPKCHGAITWAHGSPIKVSRDNGASAPGPRPTERPWSQFRKLR